MDKAKLPLTIDTRNLGDVWLPAYRAERAAVDEVKKTLDRAKWPSARWTALNRAHNICVRELENTVHCICDRGGLLLIGGSAAQEGGAA